MAVQAALEAADLAGILDHPTSVFSQRLDGAHVLT